MDVQTVRLAYKRLKNDHNEFVASYTFKYDIHGTGRIETTEDVVISLTQGEPWTVDTGLRFMLISNNPEVNAGGYYYTALPVVNSNLKVALTGSTPSIIKCPFSNVTCTTPYNLEAKNNKNSLNLTFIPRIDTVIGHTIPKGTILCYVHFPVIFDLIDKISCYEYN